MTGNPSEVTKKSKIAKEFEKIAEEAARKGKTPMLALRYFDPDSPLANNEGWIDLVIKRATDEAYG